MGAAAIATGTHLDRIERAGLLSLIYAAGSRPRADDIAALLEAPAQDGAQAAAVSHRPPAPADWLELLASGLTFDLHGLGAEPSPLPLATHTFGLAGVTDVSAFEAIALQPGPHVAAAANALPVVRTMAALAARIAQHTGAVAVGWLPAGSWMEVGYFARVVTGWLSGGPFPALGLTALERLPDGGLRSVGLEWFIGQELLLEHKQGEPAAAAVKLAVRIIDLLVREGALRHSRTIPGPDGESLSIKPVQRGKVLQALRGPNLR